MRHDAESLKDKGWMNRSGEQTPFRFHTSVTHPGEAKKFLNLDSGTPPDEAVAQMFKKGYLRVGPMDGKL